MAEPDKGLDAQQLADQLNIRRGQAIEEYTSLERSVFSIFTHLIQQPPNIAAIIFYRITNTKARNVIVEELAKERRMLPEDFKFLGHILSLVRGLDQTRNEIAHWHTMVEISRTESGEVVRSSGLTKPNFWAQTSTVSVHTIESLIAFKHKCEFAMRLANMFHVHLRDPSVLQAPWPDIFRKPIIYPPPTDHPLHLMPTEQPSPHQSSQG